MTTTYVDYTRTPTRLHCSCGSTAFAATDRHGTMQLPEEWSGCTLTCLACYRILTVDGAVIGRRVR